MTLGQFLGHQTAGVEYQVGLLQHLPATHRDEVGVARTGTYYLDVRAGNIVSRQMLTVGFFLLTTHRLTLGFLSEWPLPRSSYRP